MWVIVSCRKSSLGLDCIGRLRRIRTIVLCCCAVPRARNTGDPVSMRGLIMCICRRGISEGAIEILRELLTADGTLVILDVRRFAVGQAINRYTKLCVNGNRKISETTLAETSNGTHAILREA